MTPWEWWEGVRAKVAVGRVGSELLGRTKRARWAEQRSRGEGRELERGTRASNGDRSIGRARQRQSIGRHKIGEGPCDKCGCMLGGAKRPGNKKTRGGEEEGSEGKEKAKQKGER